jgi:hypothetical protein
MLQPLIADDLTWRNVSIIHNSIAMVLGKDTDGIGNMPVCMSLWWTWVGFIDCYLAFAFNI